MNVSFKMADLYKGVDPYRVYDELAVLGDNVKPAEIVEADLADIYKLLSGAKRPCILAGTGVMLSGASCDTSW